MKIESDRPAASAENDSTESGVSQAISKSIAVAVPPSSALPMALTMSTASTTIWIATRT
jgi:hypothetical protein